MDTIENSSNLTTGSGHMKKLYQVFISSTYEDLQEERLEVIDVLLKADCIPVGMELFPAADESQWEMIKKRINQADYYAVIIAGKYGSEYNGKSYTQREYEYAISKRKPVITLIHKDTESLPFSKSEKDSDKRKKLQNFIKIAQKRMCAFWATKEELAAELFHAIDKLKESNSGHGWIKATPYNLKKIAERRQRRLQNKINKLKADRKKIIEQLRIYDENQNNSLKNLSHEFSSRLNQIDTRVNNLFPELIRSQRTGKKEKFSSSRLIDF